MRRKVAQIEVPDSVLEREIQPCRLYALYVPQWALKQVTLRGVGVRPDRYPKHWESDQHRPGCRNFRPFIGAGSAESDEKINLPKGNLNGDDYRFFRGTNMPNFERATCRWCLRAVYGKAERRDHLRHAGKCSHLLRELYKFCQEQVNPTCLHCGMDTRHSKWGFPLCNTFTCRSRWMFDETAQHIGFRLMKEAALKSGKLDELLAEERKHLMNIRSSAEALREAADANAANDITH